MEGGQKLGWRPIIPMSRVPIESVKATGPPSSPYKYFLLRFITLNMFYTYEASSGFFTSSCCAHHRFIIVLGGENTARGNGQYFLFLQHYHLIRTICKPKKLYLTKWQYDSRANLLLGIALIVSDKVGNCALHSEG